MIISESAVEMQSKRSYVKTVNVEKTESSSLILSFTDLNGQNREVSSVETVNEKPSTSNQAKLKFATLIYLWKQMFQKNGRGGFFDEMLKDMIEKSGFSIRTETCRYSMSEEENTEFSSTGSVKCADGRTIEFDIAVGMSRAFCEEYSISMESVVQNVYLDPLVINLDCDACDIKKQTFMFDLNCDGTKEEIGVLSEGSGFLAMDLNGNGEIDDGSELFGTKSGDGFYDLSKYDEDGNGWIDEADSVYSKLRIFSVDTDGKTHQYGLKESDVGAIYLGEIKTKFSLTDRSNNELGRVKSSGIFLKESGGAGTVQNIDFTISANASSRPPW